MKNNFIYTFFTLAFLSIMIGGCVQNTTEPENKKPDYYWGKVTGAGLFKALNKGSVTKSTDTATGKIIHGAKVEFQERTDRIPLRKGVFFGYRYWIKLPPDQFRPKLKRVLIHPPMTLPDGSKVTRAERLMTRKAIHGIVTAFDVYALSEDYELVEGDWTFQLWYEGKKLTEQKFITYWPDENNKTTDKPPGKKITATHYT